jgi:hypothetical protein
MQCACAANDKIAELEAHAKARAASFEVILAENLKLQKALQEIAYSDHLANLWSRIAASNALLGVEE